MDKKILSSYGLSAIVLLLVLATAMPVSAQVQMAEKLGVEDAMGNPNTYVKIPVNITNTMNGPIENIGFYLLYDGSVLNLTDDRIGKSDLTSNWPFIIREKEAEGKYFIALTAMGIPEVGIPNGTPIANESGGSVVILNFSVIGAGGTKSNMNLSEIKMKNVNEVEGSAPAKNGTFRVDAGAPSVTNPTANPGTIVADGVQESRLNVTVVDDIAVDVVVTANLTQIGGPSKKVMAKIDGTLYSTTTNASFGTPPGTYYLPINATDLLGNYNNTVNITLNITSPLTGSITGKIMYSNNGTGIAAVNVNLTNLTSVVKTTTTNATGYYNFTNVIPGGYYVNASKPRFWDNSTSVTVTAGATTPANMMLWLKGDLDNDGMPADKQDVVLMLKAYLTYITPDYRYDLNKNGVYADKQDVVLILKAYLGYVVLI